MIDGNSVLAIIPARGGSKRLPRKNILPLLDKPLIAWTIEAALSSRFIDRCIVSTEDKEIANTARKYGCDVPFVRPEELATDKALSNSVYFHALNALPDKYDIVIFLQPTSPLREANDIDQALELMQSNNSKSLISVTELNYPLDTFLSINQNQKLSNYFKKNTKLLNLNQNYTIYRYNGAIKAIYANKYINDKCFKIENATAFIMPLIKSVDIDCEIDLIYTENILKMKLIN